MVDSNIINTIGYCFEISNNCYIFIRCEDFWEAINKSKTFIDTSNLNWYKRKDLPKTASIVLTL